MAKHTREELYQWQALPLSVKISMTKQRIRDWVNEFGLDGVYVSFSGGKDSSVLLHIAREMYGNSIKAVFIDTGLEYPEIRELVKTYENVDWVRPKKHFRQVCEEYGFPLISKEVSECVYGAKKYLTSILDEMNASTNERTNERTKHPYAQYYRKLRGIGEYFRPENAESGRGKQSEVGNHVRYADKRSTDKGEYP